MIELKPDQEVTVAKLRKRMGQGVRSILLRGEVGSGKTVMTSYIASKIIEKGNTFMMVAPRRVLVEQISDTFKNFGINHSFVAAGYKYKQDSNAWVASLDTLIGRLNHITIPSVVAIDETHHGSVGLDTVIRFFKSKGCWIIGLSATPWKLSGKGLGCWYDDMVHGPSMKELIAMGRLSDYRPFSPSKVDLKGLRSQNGDYAKNQLNDRFGNDKKLIGDIVGHYKKHALGKLGITFAVSIDASKRLAQAYRDAGVPAMHIDGTTPDDDRKKIIRAYARRELHQLTNCNLLSFGFDLSSASGGMDVTIECMSDGYPTKSLSNQRQKWGRVLRKKDQPALIFDHVNNFEEHGYPDDDIDWTLEDREKKKRNDDGERLLPVRTCPECQFSHRPTPSCPNCGFTYPVIGRDLEQVDGELHEIQIRQEKKEKRMEVGKARTPQEKIAIEKERGYKKGWAYNQCLATRLISKEMTFYDFYKRYSND